MPTMTPLKSSNVSYAGYDPATRELHVTFASGGTYIYSGVDEATYQGLVEAPSPGSYFHRHIKNQFRDRRE